MDDWDTVTVLRKQPQRAKDAKSEAALNQARRAGTGVASEKKCK